MSTIDFKITSDLSGLKKLEKNCRTMNNRHIRFGWYEGKNYPSSHPNAGIPIAQVAYWQEYGIGGDKPLPSRPYFRQAINKFKRGHYNQIKKVFLTGLHGNNVDTVLKPLSESTVIDYKKSVSVQNYKKLSDYTVSLKGHSYQMLDSGVMMDNFKARVYKQKQEHIKDS